jgi:hypothetical protein
VLFVDLKGAMEILDVRDLGAAQGILDSVLERLMAAVHHYEGSITPPRRHAGGWAVSQ